MSLHIYFIQFFWSYLFTQVPSGKGEGINKFNEPALTDISFLNAKKLGITNSEVIQNGNKANLATFYMGVHRTPSQ